MYAMMAYSFPSRKNFVYASFIFSRKDIKNLSMVAHVYIRTVNIKHMSDIIWQSVKSTIKVSNTKIFLLSK